MGTFDYTYEERQVASSEDKYQKFYIETPIEDLDVTIGAEDTEAINVACQIVDPAGDAINEQIAVQCLLFDSADYDTALTTALANVTVAAGTAGSIAISLIDHVSFTMVSDATGAFDMDWTDAGGAALEAWIGFILPNGKFVEGGHIAFTA